MNVNEAVRLDESKLKRFFRLVSETQAQLLRDHPTGVVHVTSVEHPDLIEHKPGVVFTAFPAVAAKLVVRRTHRESTPEEIVAYDRDLAERTRVCESEEIRFRGQRGQVVISNRLRSEIEGGGPEAA